MKFFLYKNFVSLKFTLGCFVVCNRILALHLLPDTKRLVITAFVYTFSKAAVLNFKFSYQPCTPRCFEKQATNCCCHLAVELGAGEAREARAAVHGVVVLTRLADPDPVVVVPAKHTRNVC